jgi:acetyl-CoA acetyltransferase
MRYERASIPLGKYWTSPFARWQGPFAEMSSLDLATVTTAWALEDRRLSPRDLSHIVLGWSVPQPGIFYGAPTVAARLGAPGITGPMISQACATSVACLQAAALMAEAEADGLGLVIATDRTSNGPHLIYPSPSRPGGAPSSENWVLDSFRRDPWAGKAMIDTAEKVAADSGITREELDEVTLLRYDQYRDALANDRAFQRAYMVPVEIRAQRGDPQVIGGDVGIHETSSEGLAKLEPVLPDGVITYGSQTHPADGAAGMVVASKEVARDVAGDGGYRPDPELSIRSRRQSGDAEGTGACRPRRAQGRGVGDKGRRCCDNAQPIRGQRRVVLQADRIPDRQDEPLRL